MTVLFLPSAQVDFEHIHDFIAEDNPAKAQEFIALLKKQCLALGENPRMGRSRPEIRDDLRGLSVPPYIIFYRIDKVKTHDNGCCMMIIIIYLE